MVIWASALAAVLATWCLLIVLFAGMGLLARRGAGLRVLDADALILAVWIGIAFTIAVLQLWNFFLPIGAPAAALVGAVGLTGLALARRELVGWLRGIGWRRHLPLLVVMLGVVAFAANRAMGPLTSYDGGAYHIPVMEWARAYPVVPGLANLHGRLGFNNSSLLFAALLDDGPWTGRANHLVNGFLIALLLVQAVLHTTRLPRSTGAIRLRYAFDLALIAPLMALLMANSLLTGYTPDVPAGVTLLAALSLLVGHVGDRGSRGGKARAAGGEVQKTTSNGATSGTLATRARYELVAGATLLALAASMKLSVGFTALLAWGVSFALLWFHGAPGRSRRAAVVAVLASTAIMGPWLVRSAILSGYPLYPSTILAAPVDWRVPVEQAHAELAWVGHFARAEEGSVDAPYADQRLLGWNWLGAWSSQMLTDWRHRVLVGLPVALAFLILAYLLAMRIRRTVPGTRTLPAENVRKDSTPGWPCRSYAAPALWWLLGCAAAGSLFWFLTAPRLEFGFATLWALGALCVALLFVHLPAGGRAAAAVIAIALLLGISPVVGRVARVVLTFNDPLHDRIINSLLVRRGSDDGFHPPDPTAERVTTYHTESGLLLYVPAETTRCFHAPLPCTPHPAPNLRLRGADLGDGFRTDGPWLAERWPGWPIRDSRFLDSWRAWVAGADASAGEEVRGEDPM